MLILKTNGIIICDNSCESNDMDQQGKRGPKPKVSLETQKLVISEFKDDFFKNIPSANDSIYKQIQTRLNYKMSIKSIILSIKRNYEYFFGVDKKEIIRNNDSNLINQKSTSSSNESINSVSENTSTHTFYMDTITWDSIKPQRYFYHRNSKIAPGSLYNVRRKLKPNQWTNVIQMHLWKEIRSLCTWCFKNNIVKDNYEIKCTGYCNQCHAKIIITTNLETENLIKLECCIINENKKYSHNTSKKNRLRYYQIRELGEKLQHEAAASIRYKLASTLMKKNDKEPPVLPKLQTLHRIKHENKKGDVFHPNPILSLTCMCVSPPFDKCVRYVSAFPFYTFYWTDDQKNYYKKCQKEFNYIRVSIDATGSIFNKNLRPVVNEHTQLSQESQSPIFLYVMMTDTTVKSSVPISQCISESHSLDTIASWLQSWLANGKPPNEVVTDDSAALVGAVVKVFCGYKSTSDYLNTCFNILENRTKKIPTCYVRLDTSHFIKTLYNQSIFKNIDTRVTKFFVDCMILIKKCVSYGEVKKIIENVYIIANNKHRGSRNGNLTRCETAILELKNRIKTNLQECEIQNVDSENHVPIKHSLWEGLDKEENPLLKMYKDLEEKEDLIKQLCDQETEIENMYYLPEIKDTLIRILKKLPLWGNIMMTYFNSNYCTPTSSNVESYMKDVKKLFFKTNSNKYRVDEFIIKHEPLITGSIRLAKSDLIDVQEGTENIVDEKNEISDHNTPQINTLVNDESFYENSIFRSEPNYIEDWRGLVSKQKKNKKRINRRTKLHILQNGSVSTSGTYRFTFINTCAFDSVVQSFSIAYLDRPNIRKYINDKKNDLSQLTRSLITYDNLKKITKKARKPKDIYTTRSKVLAKIYDTVESDFSSCKNCECNVTFIIDNIQSYGFYSANRYLNCTNQNCEINKGSGTKCSWIPINVNILTTQGIGALNEALLVNDTERKCKYQLCNGKNAYKYEVLDFVFIEINTSIEIEIDEIPKEIIINGDTFKILSVIDFTNGESGRMGHYKSKCYRLLKRTWNCYDDLSKKVCSNSQYTVPHCIIYTRM